MRLLCSSHTIAVTAVFLFSPALSHDFNVVPERPLITAAPDFSPFQILDKRDSASICGYINGNINSPLSCDDTSVCTYIGSTWGCCDSTTCQTPGTCDGYGGSKCGTGTAWSINCPYSQILQCTDEHSPYCITYVRESNPADGAKKTSWGCGGLGIEVVVMANTASTVSTTSKTNVFSASTFSSSSPTSTSSSESIPNSATSESSSSSSSSSGLSTSDKIALGVGIPAAIAALLALIPLVKCVCHRRESPAHDGIHLNGFENEYRNGQRSMNGSRNNVMHSNINASTRTGRSISLYKSLNNPWT